jgi:ribosomal protein S18 acetylase RimI-like enzyme
MSSGKKTNLALKLGKSKPEEFDALVRLATYTGMFKKLEVKVLGELLRDWHTSLAKEGHICCTLKESDGTPVGFVYHAPAVMTKGTWHLYWLVVDKNAQGRGLGKRMVRYAEADARKRGGHHLLAETSGTARYASTRTFYDKVGYSVEARVRDFYAPGDDQVIYRKDLRR